MTYEAVLHNARLVLADEVVDGHMVLRDGWIQAIGHGRVKQPAAIDCEGDFLFPGLVEVHTDNLEKHLLPRPGAFWPVDAAVVAHDAQLLASGITTALDALSVGDDAEESPLDPIATALALERAHHAGRLRVDHHLHVRCELPCPDLPVRLAPMLEQPRLRLISLMDHTPGQRQFRDLGRYRAYSSRHGVAWDEVDFTRRLDRLRAQQEAYAAPHRALVVAQAKARSVRLASHDDADAAHIDEAVACQASIAEFPVTLEAARVARAAGLQVLAGAPNLVRGGSHSGNVAAAELASERTLSLLSSDYVPASLLHAVFLLARLPGWTLASAVATASATPAKAVGFRDRGAIAPGLRADVLRVRESASVPVLQAVWIAGKQRY